MREQIKVIISGTVPEVEKPRIMKLKNARMYVGKLIKKYGLHRYGKNVAMHGNNCVTIKSIKNAKT